jgi:hypothetical protein
MGFSPVEKTDGRIKQFPNSDIEAILDTDWCAFSIASVGDAQYIEATHKKTKKVAEFKNVTEFRGVGKKIGGWLAERNEILKAKGKPLYTLEDFTIEQKQRRKKEYTTKTISMDDWMDGLDDEFSDYTYVETEANGTEVKIRKELTDDEALINIFHSAKAVIVKALEDLGTHKYESYLGRSGAYRLNISTLMKYKGNRDKTLKPLVFKDVVGYISDSFNSTMIDNIENDDAVVMRAYKDPNAVIVGEDKDFYGQPVKFFNANRPEDGIIDGDCFGELTTYDKKKSKTIGFGRLFLYHQICTGDASDNYKANCQSEVKYGTKGGYDDLKDCKDDKEALEKLIEIYKRLYPKPIVVKSWRGNPMLIDWLYVARENFKMAAMLRFEGDSRTLDTEFAEYGVEYEY